jgi:hypothetical protein
VHLPLLILCCLNALLGIDAGALLLASLLLLPESPRWLVLRGQLDLALTTLHKIIESSGTHASASSSNPLDGVDSSEQQVGLSSVAFAIICSA